MRPIAADNSCLFNAVGYTMHHSTSRAPFLRQVVAREVSSDPQVRAPLQPHCQPSALPAAQICSCIGRRGTCTQPAAISPTPPCLAPALPPLAAPPAPPSASPHASPPAACKTIKPAVPVEQQCAVPLPHVLVADIQRSLPGHGQCGVL
jgi:hypothetical protein